MAESSTIMSLVGAFIGIAIMLGIGIQILGNSVQDCTSLPDFNTTLGVGKQVTGWSGACENTNAQSQNAYALLIIILIVVAAVAILFVVRML